MIFSTDQTCLENVLIELFVVRDGEDDGVDLLEELDVVDGDVAEIDPRMGAQVGHGGLVELGGVRHGF